MGQFRYRAELLQTAIGEINAAEPDVVVVAGDLTDDGYPDRYPLAKRELEAIACERVILVPGNHDARNVGYRSSRTPSARGTPGCGSSSRGSRRGRRHRLVEARPGRGRDRARALRLDRGGLRRRRGPPDLRLPPPPVPVPGTGRERNQVRDAGDVISLLRQLRGRSRAVRAPPRPVRVAHSRMSSSTAAQSPRPGRADPRTRVRLDSGRARRIAVELEFPAAGARSLGEYLVIGPRNCPRGTPIRSSGPGGGGAWQTTGALRTRAAAHAARKIADAPARATCPPASLRPRFLYGASASAAARAPPLGDDCARAGGGCVC